MRLLRLLLKERPHLLRRQHPLQSRLSRPQPRRAGSARPRGGSALFVGSVSVTFLLATYSVQYYDTDAYLAAYTSLLRITTAPPPAGATATSPVSPTSPAAPNAPAAEEESGACFILTSFLQERRSCQRTGGGGGLLGGLSGLRPAFLRGLSMRGERAAPRDIEAQV